jgi:hypothetical protein
MSKKSRKRNKKILSALALLGTGLALANRGKGTEMSNISVDSGRGSGLRPTVDDIEFKESIVTTPNVVSTPKTIKDSQVLGRMRGSGDSGGFTGQKKRADYARTQRNLSNDRRRNDMLRAIRSTQDIYTSPDSILQGVPESALMAKKGGRIVKGKKTAVRRRKK